MRQVCSASQRQRRTVRNGGMTVTGTLGDKKVGSGADSVVPPLILFWTLSIFCCLKSFFENLTILKKSPRFEGRPIFRPVMILRFRYIKDL